MNTHDYLQIASQAFLVEPLPDLGPWDRLSEEDQETWLCANAWEPLAKYCGPELWGFIEDHAATIEAADSPGATDQGEDYLCPECQSDDVSATGILAWDGHRWELGDVESIDCNECGATEHDGGRA